MFTILRKINGNRTPTEHESPTLGGPDSQVFKDAMALLEESRITMDAMDSNMDAKPWVDMKPKPIEEWVERFEKAYGATDTDNNELVSLVNELSPGMFDVENARFASDFGQLEEAYLKDTGQTIIWKCPKGLPIDIQFKDIPNQSPETLHTTLDFIEAGELKFAVYNSKQLWTNYNTANLVGGEPTEVSSVELQYVYHDGESMPKEMVLKSARRGNRSLDMVIGVLSYDATEHNDDGMLPDTTRAVYEFFYQGDEVYITNRFGKTVDSIR